MPRRTSARNTGGRSPRPPGGLAGAPRRGQFLVHRRLGPQALESRVSDAALQGYRTLAVALYFAAFSILSARERRRFWATMPSKTLVAALLADVLTGTALTLIGLPGLMPLPWWQTLAVFGFSMVACLGVNDAIKVAMIKWRVPTAALLR